MQALKLLRNAIARDMITSEMAASTNVRSMPTIAIVDGVRIMMFYNDHNPPHFHARLGGDEVLVAIRDLGVIRGSLPQAKLNQILVWAQDHQDELALNWMRCQDSEEPQRI
jgi:uncharacterized protein DUF4160